MGETAARRWFDKDTGEYPPDLYQYHAIAEGVNGFEAITDGHIQQFHEQGYLVIHQAFTPAEIQTTLDALLSLVDGRNPAFKGIQFEAKARDILGTLPAEQKQDAVRKFWRFVNHDVRLKTFSHHPKLIAVLTRIMGEEPELFQDMALFKPPAIGREKPWHQDHAYFNLPLDTTVVGAWIALDEATVENGCMHINPGTHREGPIVHFQRRDWQICDTDVSTQRTMAVPLKPGGCLLFDSLLQHGTPANRSDQRRRAVQFHYKPASVGKTFNEDRMVIFGSEGKDVTC